MGTRSGSVFREKFKGVGAGGELGGFRCPGWEVEGRTALEFKRPLLRETGAW